MPNSIRAHRLTVCRTRPDRVDRRPRLSIRPSSPTTHNHKCTLRRNMPPSHNMPQPPPCPPWHRATCLGSPRARRTSQTNGPTAQGRPRRSSQSSAKHLSPTCRALPRLRTTPRKTTRAVRAAHQSRAPLQGPPFRLLILPVPRRRPIPGHRRLRAHNKTRPSQPLRWSTKNDLVPRRASWRRLG